jgi:hypothetical protein
MLRTLFVKDFAIIDGADVVFASGLTVLTGETGAGKSLLVDALMLLAGARGDAGVVRHGAERAEMSAEFDLRALPQARAWLREQELDDEEQLRLRRVVRADGSSRAWINDRPVSLSVWSRSTASTNTRRCSRASTSSACSTPSPSIRNASRTWPAPRAASPTWTAASPSWPAPNRATRTASTTCVSSIRN